MPGKQVLFMANASLAAFSSFAELTGGPGVTNSWEVDVIYLANISANDVGVSLRHVKDSTSVLLLNNTTLHQGETLSVGPIVLDAEDSLDAEVLSGDVDIIAYGTEISGT